MYFKAFGISRRSIMFVFVVPLLSHTWLSATMWTATHQASPSFAVSGVCSISCPLCHWCRPTISCSLPPSPPAPNLSQHQSHFQRVAIQRSNKLLNTGCDLTAYCFPALKNGVIRGSLRRKWINGKTLNALNESLVCRFLEFICKTGINYIENLNNYKYTIYMWIYEDV